MLPEKCAYLFGDFLASTFLSNAFRWPECLGLSPGLKEEANLQANIMQSMRLIFENCLTCTPLPVSTEIPSYDINDINGFITYQKEKILKFYGDILSSV